MLELDHTENNFDTKIKIVGVGGAGGNAINTMIENGLTGVEYIAVNTDVMDLRKSKAKIKLQIGKKATRGLGAGADPERGNAAASESTDDIKAVLEGSDMIIIAAGMGGGTGTGAAPIVASVAQELGILTLAIVTRPFPFEGNKRRANAEKGIAGLRKSVDTLIAIPNEKLCQIYKDIQLMEAFGKADSILYEAAKAISDIINQSGYINVDFADVKAVMSNMGYALMGTGIATGENRAINAAKDSIQNPLLSDINLHGCKALLINVTGGYDMKLSEFEEVSNVIVNETGSDANIITGLIMNEEMSGSIRVTIIATGVSAEADGENVIAMPEIHAKDQQEEKKELEEIFSRINQTTSTVASSEKDKKTVNVEPFKEKYDIPSFLRKFSD